MEFSTTALGAEGLRAWRRQRANRRRERTCKDLHRFCLAEAGALGSPGPFHIIQHRGGLLRRSVSLETHQQSVSQGLAAPLVSGSSTALRVHSGAGLDPNFLG